MKQYSKDNVTMEHVFRDTVSKLRVAQFSSINKLTRAVLSPGITDQLLSFSPIQYPLSRDGYFAYLHPCEVDKTLLKNKDSYRRLWAGGSMELYSPMQFDKDYSCVETIKRTRRTSTGVFLTLERNILDRLNQFPLLKETRLLAYTNSKPTISDVNPLSHLEVEKSQLIDTIEFNEENIIKYSILSSNPHRVHWDKKYCVDMEGYKNMIVPGPYILQLTANIIESYIGCKLTNIKYRNINFIYPNTQLNLHCNHTLKTFWLSNKGNPELIYFTLNIND